MNRLHLMFICTELQLGSPESEVASVHGSRSGSLMWRVNTEKMSYAIKQLAPVIDLKSERMITKYELSEAIAHRFAQHGIPAVSAIEKLGKRLIIIENSGYLVYPWIDGYTFPQNIISEYHALRVAELIAKMHSINMYVPEIKSPHVDIYSCDQIIEAIDKALSFKCSFAKTLQENQSLVLSMNEHYISIIPLLLEDTLITHGDLDQLNIIWVEENQPVLIDWESARKLNPTREITRACMVWGGVGTDHFSPIVYERMLRAYTNLSNTYNVNHVNAALYSSVGSMINWMLYNIEIACISDAAEAKSTAINEVNGVMLTMTQFNTLAPDLLKIGMSL